MGDLVKMPKKCRHSVIDKLGRKLVCDLMKHEVWIVPHKLVLATGDKRDTSPKVEGTSP